MTFRLSAAARQDLRDVRYYIARDNPRRAASFVAELRAVCKRIGEHPAGYPETDPPRRGRRRAVHGDYLILYAATPRGADILRVLHAARDWPKLLD